MIEFIRENAGPLLLVGLMVLAVLAFAALMVAVEWYRAGLQAGVYQRQGVEMTTWEVFMGAKPAERTINIKPQETEK